MVGGRWSRDGRRGSGDVSERGGAERSSGLKPGMREMAGSHRWRPALAFYRGEGETEDREREEAPGAGGRAGPGIQVTCLQRSQLWSGRGSGWHGPWLSVLCFPNLRAPLGGGRRSGAAVGTSPPLSRKYSGERARRVSKGLRWRCKGADKRLWASPWGMTWVWRGKMGDESPAFLPPHPQADRYPQARSRLYVSVSLERVWQRCWSRLIPACES